MKINIIFFILFIFIILSNCTKEDNPFAPPENRESADFEIIAIPTVFTVADRNDPGSYANIVTGLELYTKGDYIAGFEVESKWWKSSKYFSVMNNPIEGDMSQFINRRAETSAGDYYNFFNEQDTKHYSYVITNSSFPPATAENTFKIDRYETVSYFRTPVFRVLVSDPDKNFYLKKQYRIRAFNIQGNNTEYKNFEVKFCDAHLLLQRVDKYSKEARGSIIVDTSGLVGYVINENGGNYTVEFRIPTDYALGLYNYQFEYSGNNQRTEQYMWQVVAVAVIDLGNNPSPTGDLIGQNIYFSVEMEGQPDMYELENITRQFGF